MSNVYGYIRVSSKDQCVDRQRIALMEAGLPEGCLFIDTQSGKDFNRPAYRRLLRKLKPGDTLVIQSIDRLGRNYEETLAQWRMLTKKKQVNMRVLNMPILNTNKDRDLMGTVIADIILEIQSCFAQAERDYIHQRQAAGIRAAKERGVRFGRPPMERPVQFDAVKKRWEDKEISARGAAKELGISLDTFLRWSKE